MRRYPLDRKDYRNFSPLAGQQRAYRFITALSPLFRRKGIRTAFRWRRYPSTLTRFGGMRGLTSPPSRFDRNSLAVASAVISNNPRRSLASRSGWLPSQRNSRIGEKCHPAATRPRALRLSSGNLIVHRFASGNLVPDNSPIRVRVLSALIKVRVGFAWSL